MSELAVQPVPVRRSGERTGDAPHRLTPVQWLVCIIACLGFSFDLYETLMLPLIVRPVLITLGRLQPGTAAFNLWVGLLFSVPTATGGVFGLLGGYLTDLLGRRKVLVWSILLYAFSACAASYAISLSQFMILRCTTMIGVCVEYVAAVTWVAELFPDAARREFMLGSTQAFYTLGGLVVAAAYYVAVSLGEHFPSIRGTHDAWRYTLLSGLLPAIPLMIVRPFLPESPMWKAQRSLASLKRPNIRELFCPALRRTTLTTTLLVACTVALGFGVIQQTVRMVPSLAEVRQLGAKHIEQTVSHVQVFQELGGLTGRAVFVFLVIRVAAQRRRMRIFLAPGLLVFSWVYFFAATRSLTQLYIGIFLATLLFNGIHSFWGNYLPRSFPTHLRGTGESFAMNIGGRTIGVFAAFVTAQLSTIIPGPNSGARLAYSAGSFAVLACLAALIGSSWLIEPSAESCPNKAYAIAAHSPQSLRSAQ